MSTTPEQVAEALRASVKETQRLRKQNRELIAAAREPIAIVGMSCRLPGGVGSPEQLWKLVLAGEDAIGEFPSDRGWDMSRLYDPDPDHPGTSYVREGGFLYDAGEFDADFFRVSPRDALGMDPQQRLFLEASWEALEHAAIDPTSLRGTRTGVFAGVMYEDYPIDPRANSEAGGKMASSNSASILSGRTAYLLGLEGPALSVGTACSSSLVAMHLACAALRSGECSMALAGGVTTMAQPSLFVGFSMQGVLAKDARCKSFADSADGSSWSEGVGIVVLERLSEAQRLGHPVLGLIRGSAVNQDGASNGFNAPNGPAQQRVIRQALASAGISPTQVDAVEAHGTGTTLGDPIEAQALLATYGQGRDTGHPLRLGSIKSNIGHTQAAAGVTGVIKMVMAMRQGLLPKTLHVDAPSRHVDWSAGDLRLLTEPESWPAGERPRRAGVSSFGMSGTNAHMILEESPAMLEQSATPERSEVPTIEPPAAPLLLSAKSEAALEGQAERLALHLQAHPEVELLDVAYSLATTRARFERRAAVLGGGREQAIEGLHALAGGEASARVIWRSAPSGKTAFMFTGQGSQRTGMGKDLYRAFPVFAAALDEVYAQFASHLDGSLKEVMFAEEDAPEAEALDRTEFTQAALFALELGLFRLVESLGVRPDILIGHSIGEIVAAHVAGVFSLADACRLVAARGRAMGALPPGGGMLALEAGEPEIAELLAGYGQRLSLAAVNAPRALVISGEEQALEELAVEWQARGRKAKRLRVSHAFHSALMEPGLAQFRDVALDIELHVPRIPIVSNVTGRQGEAADYATADYWVKHARNPVRFADGVGELHGLGVTRFLELGPQGLLTAAAGDCLGEDARRGVLLAPTMRASRPEVEAFGTFLAEAHVNGADVDWQAFFAKRGARRVDLPTYAFQRRRYWHELTSGVGNLSAAGLTAVDHPLLGAQLLRAGDGGHSFTGRISLTTHPWLADHAVLGTVLLPGTAFAELALAAGRGVGCDLLEELTLELPLVLTKDGAAQLQVSLGEPDESGRRSIAVYSREEHRADEADEGHQWRCHSRGTLAQGAGHEPVEPEVERLASQQWPPPGAEPIEVADFYEELASAGLEYGPAFRGLHAAWRLGEAIFAEVKLDSGQAVHAARFGVHPALFDAALHGGLLTGQEATETGTPQLPFLLKGVKLYGSGAGSLRVRIAPAGESACTLAVVDGAGAPTLSVASILARPIDAAKLGSAAATGPDSLYKLEWAQLPHPAASGQAKRLVLLGDAGRDRADDRAAIDGGSRQGESVDAGYANVEALVEAIDSGAPPPDAAILALVGSGANEPEVTDEAGGFAQATHTAAREVLEMLHLWLAEERLADCPLVLVSRGAVAIGDHEIPDPVSAASWGLIRSAQSEHPGRFLLVDVAPDLDLACFPWMAMLACEETQLVLRGEDLYAPRITLFVSQAERSSEPGESGPASTGNRVASSQNEDEPHAAGSGGTVLITGGTGALGSLVARHLARKHGIQSLLLLSRRGMAAKGAEQLVDELAELGCSARVLACDVSDRDDLSAAIDSISADRPLTAVFHTAGVVEDGTVVALDAGQLERVMRPKLDAVIHLHELTKGKGLSDFVLFSSLSGLMGSPGQANYAAANSFMDAFAQWRRANGLLANSLAWGLWSERSGMTEDVAEGARVKRSGLAELSNEEALGLMDVARRSGEPLLAPVKFDRGALRAQASLALLPPQLRGLVRVPTAGGSKLGTGSLARRLAGVPRAEWEKVTLAVVRTHVAAVLGHDSPEAIDPERAFKDLGFDSLAAVELRNLLEPATGLRLSATIVFDHPTPVALAQLLCSQISGAASVAPVEASRSTKADEPIAIVGMSCRYPGGVRSPEDLWRLVDADVDAVSPFPTDRGWDLERLCDPKPERLGASYVHEGGFMYDAGDFDAAFFGISPREALAMDPQQRIFLEMAWEAVETVGIDPRSLKGSQTGVFAGVMYQDYGLTPEGSVKEDGGPLMPGTGGSVVSGHVAYTLGLEGPAISVDTACSSSLVALHLACQALQGGECSLALAGGVTVLSTPSAFVAFSHIRGLAADGRCKSFAAAADGMGWSEGAGLLALERLSDARRLGHEVLAVVQGSAVNQDGASNGLTAPNGPSQERVIRQALANARLEADDVDVVEGHGTGTVLGDPIEIQALLATYGQRRSVGDPLWLGSVKSNMGHTQAAAGVAGVIKMVMALRKESLPRTLHVDRPSEQVDWSVGTVSLLEEARPWLGGDRPRRAGVSSFGMSGTNAHLIVEEAPVLGGARVGQNDGSGLAGDGDGDVGGVGVGGVVPWVFSGRDLSVVRSIAGRLRGFVSGDGVSAGLGDVGFSLSCRSGFACRAVVVGGGLGELCDGLGVVSDGGVGSGVFEGVVGDGRVAFLFTGQGSQRVGMGSELYRCVPRFRSALDEICAVLDECLGCSLLEVLFAGEGSSAASRLDDTMFAQAGLFALEVALFRVLEGWGVRPTYLIGHSIGELSAAFVAGVFSLEDACRLVAARGRLMSALPSGGAMVAVQACEADVLESLSGYGERVGLAAVNGPEAVVLSGDEDAVAELESFWRERGCRVKRLNVSHAFHSARMEGMLEDFAEVARGVSFVEPGIPVVSNLTGEPVGAELCSPEYWVRQVRGTVRFADGVGWLAAEGVRNFLELGPEGVLGAMTAECWRGGVVKEGDGASFASLLSSERPEALSLVSALAELWTRGVSVDWTAIFGEAGVRRVGLPTYPFQRQRYWPENSLVSRSVEDRGVDGGGDGFWDAVEREDADGLFGVLGLDGDEERGSLRALLPSLTEWRRRDRERSTVNGWRYVVRWKPVTALESGSVLSGAWLVVVPDIAYEDSWVASLRELLEVHGAHVVMVGVDDAMLGSREDLARSLRGLVDGVSGESGIGGVISLLASAERPVADCESVSGALLGSVTLLQALGDVGLVAPLWLFTRGAVSVVSTDRVCSPVQAQVWGLGAVVGLEQPQRWGGLVDLPDSLEGRVGAWLIGVLAGDGVEDQVAIRDSGLFTRRVDVSFVDKEVVADGWKPPAGTILITGGTGGLGAHVARWFARAGAEHLLLLSRRGVDAPGAGELRDELSEMGAQVTIAACDVADRGQLSEVLASLPEDRGLSVVVHTAGVSLPVALDSLAVEDLERALSAKTQGAQNLDELTEDLELSAFVLFSSISGTFGSAFQGSYAAANAYLDALAHRRRARKQTATSIAWGPWEGAGMVSSAEEIGDAMRSRGLGLMTPNMAIAALEISLAMDDPFALIADIKWDTYAPLFTSARARPLIEDLPEVQAALQATGPGEQTEAQQTAALQLRERLGTATPEQREDILLNLVRTEVARVLGHKTPDTVDPNRPFTDLGFNSITAVELRNKLNRVINLEIPTMVLMDHSSCKSMAGYIDLRLIATTGVDQADVDASDLQGIDASQSQDGSAGALVSMFRKAREDKVVEQFFDVLGSVSRLRPTFSVAAASELSLGWSTLAEGPAPNDLLCLPTTLAVSGPYQFVRFAKTFQGTRRVSALELPGFATDNRLPASLEAAVEALAVNVQRRVGDTPFVLVGQSSGGWLAHALATRLENEKRSTVSGVVLLDSPPSASRTLDVTSRGALDELLSDDVLAFVNDDRLSAMGAYMRLFEGWEPGEVGVPTLLVRAAATLPAIDLKYEDQWTLADSEIEVPGDHLTITDEHAESTAFAVQAWLTSTFEE